MKKRILTFFTFSTIFKFSVQEKSIYITFTELDYEIEALVCNQVSNFLNRYQKKTVLECL